MRRPSHRAGLAVLPVAALLLAVVSSPMAGQSSESIVGSWTAVVQTEGQADSGAVYTFTTDGTVLAVADSALFSNQVGAWQAAGPAGSFAMRLAGFAFDDTGATVGRSSIVQTATLAADGDTFEASGTLEVIDTAGEVTSTSTFTTTGTRIVAVEAVLQPVVITASGSRPADLRRSIREYKELLGGVDNLGEPGPFESGFREILWDFTPEGQSAPDAIDLDFFNGPEAPRARGAVFAEPQGVLMVSADPENSTGTLPRFGNINPTYVDTFPAHSKEKLFAPFGDTVAELSFFVPGTDTPAVVSGFGAVFVDVDTAGTTFEVLDIDGEPLGTFETPIANNGFSFLGVALPEPVIHTVRITYGDVPLGPTDGPGIDVVVTDDFIYGEPQPAQ